MKLHYLYIDLGYDGEIPLGIYDDDHIEAAKQAWREDPAWSRLIKDMSCNEMILNEKPQTKQ